MGILKIIAENLRNRPHALKWDDRVPYPQGYRGLLVYQAEACTGCKICLYVCPPGGIHFDEENGEPVVWHYNGNQCTFCGKCVDNCPAGALSFQNDAPEVSNSLNVRQLAFPLPLKKCEGCHKSFLPMPDALLASSYPGGKLPPKAAELNKFCPDCRRKKAGSQLGKRVKPEYAGQYQVKA